MLAALVVLWLFRLLAAQEDTNDSEYVDSDAAAPVQVAVQQEPLKLSPQVLLVNGHGSFHGSYLVPSGDPHLLSYQLPTMLLQCIGPEDDVGPDVREEAVLEECSSIIISYTVSVGELEVLIPEAATLHGTNSSEDESGSEAEDLTGAAVTLDLANWSLTGIDNASQLELPALEFHWKPEDCRKLVRFTALLDNGVHSFWQQLAYIDIPACPRIEVLWDGAPLSVQEDSEVRLSALRILTNDTSLFLEVTVRHPPEAAGDCRMEYWRGAPNEIVAFQGGRECVLDGTAAELVEKFRHVVYRPPVDFYGHMQLAVEVRVREFQDFALGIEVPRLAEVFNLDVDVHGENDPPTVQLAKDLQVGKEDYGPMPLAPILITDIDAHQYPVCLGVEVLDGSEGGGLQMCRVDTVEIVEPEDYVVDSACVITRAHKVVLKGTVLDLNLMFGGPISQLTFAPDMHWHGAVSLNITVDDLGGGHGAEYAKTAWRPLYLIVEPEPDVPRIEYHCDKPLIASNSTKLDVADCIDIHPDADETSQDPFFVVLVEASEPESTLNIGTVAPVRVRDDGNSSIHISGTFRHVKEAVKTLSVELPSDLRPAVDDPVGLRVDLLVTAISLGETFDDLDTEDIVGYPNATLSIPTYFRLLSPVSAEGNQGVMSA